MNTSHNNGYTLVQLLAVLVLLGLLGAGAMQSFRALRDRTETVSLQSAAIALNGASTDYAMAGGRTPYRGSEIDAEALLLALQTPADAASQRAGFGTHGLIDAKWALVPVSASETGDRLFVAPAPKTKVPAWHVSSQGEGYRVMVDANRPEPGTADWTALVNAKAAVSQVGARTSKWIWEYDDTPNSAPVAGPVTPPATTPDYTAADALLSIVGPKEIRSAGSYYWTGVASIPGTLTITAQGLRASAAAATSVLSPKLTFGPGDRLMFYVGLRRDEGGSIAALQVVVDIPAVPVVTIEGPDVVTTLEPVTWTATSSENASPIAIRVTDAPEATAFAATSVSATHDAWPPGTKIDNFKITASALNQSGLDVMTKFVRIDIPAPPPDPTEDPDPEVTDTEVLCSWTVSVDGDGEVQSLTLSGAGGATTVTDGARSHTFKKALAPGTYTISGSAVVDGQTIPASVNGSGSDLTLTVTP